MPSKEPWPGRDVTVDFRRRAFDNLGIALSRQGFTVAMNRRRRWILVGISLSMLTAFGCADTIYYTPLNQPPRPLVVRPVEAVETFAVTPPARPHTNVGLFQIVQGTNDHSGAAMIAEARVRAAAMGCDAILITSIDHRSDRYTSPSVQVSCLVYNDPPAGTDVGQH